MKFEELNINSDMIESLKRNNITAPTKIQEGVIPAAMQGNDVEAQSETGSGKTLAFAIPMMEKINKNEGIQGLVLAPTRELARQITEEFQKFAGKKRLYTLPVYGGASITSQIRNLPRTEIVVGTPGRILDLIERGDLNFKHLKILVLDEADRMLDMGFVHDIERIMKSIQKKVQTMLFSATYPNEIKSICKRYLHNPKKITVEATIHKGKLTQCYYDVRQNDKFSLLVELLKQEKELSLIFCKTKRMTDRLAKNLRLIGIKASSLNGDMSQNKRDLVVSDFKTGRINILVATDVAARGIHVENISHVYNYDLPDTVDTYTHRIGRTARAGKEGASISLVCDFDHDNFSQIMRYKRDDMKKMPLPVFEKIPFQGGEDRQQGQGSFQRGRYGNRNREGNRRPGQGSSRGEGRRESTDRPRQSSSGGFGGGRGHFGVKPKHDRRGGDD